MSRRTAVLNVVGLTSRHIGPHTPHLKRFADAAGIASVQPAFPAVTCTAQATYLTGLPPAEHGIVGNGWYNRELAEVHFWKQSNRLVSGRKLWEALREIRPGFTCAKIFWWFNMYSSVDYSITPRPLYPADGRKVPDIYSKPLSIRDEIKRDIGDFPFHTFWGPMAGIESSRWIAKSAEWIEERYKPDLSLVYLPHLDYNLQRLGPDDPATADELKLIDEVVGGLLDFYASCGVEVAVLSEYGIAAVERPVHLNRIFRQHGWLCLKQELGSEMLDCGASRAFAIADHQVAHVYVNDRALLSKVRAVLEGIPGVERVLGEDSKASMGIKHSRAGDLIAVADPGSWFTYYYWEEDRLAPDFARTSDIHRKPGYDPTELFFDPRLPFPKLTVASFLIKRRLGFRALLKVVPLQPELIRGSHGSPSDDSANWPILLLPRIDLAPEVEATDVYQALLSFCR